MFTKHWTEAASFPFPLSMNSKEHHSHLLCMLWVCMIDSVYMPFPCLGWRWHAKTLVESARLHGTAAPLHNASVKLREVEEQAP